MDRRTFLTTAGVAGAAALAATRSEAAATNRFQNGKSPWPLVMNSSTVRHVPMSEQIEAVAKAGWDGIELWVNDLEKYETEGGNLKELGQHIRDLGLIVPNIIGLWNSLPSTPEEFEKVMPASRNRMRMSADVGATHVAVLPGPDRADIDLKYMAEQYREYLRIGKEDYGIVPAIEFIGFLKGVHRLGQAAAIAIDANDADACIIADTFHMWRGEGGFNGLKLASADILGNFHWNDVKAGTPREGSGDSVRVLPGDGDLPLEQALRDLKSIGYDGALSLELFNDALWKQPVEHVCEIGLRKMRENIAAAGV